MKILRKTTFLLPFFLLISLYESDARKIFSQEEILIKTLIEKNSLDFEDIPNLVIENNLELKALRELINSSSLNLASKISAKYPRLDLNASGLPQYLYGKNYNSSSIDTKSSQLKLNPSLNIRWDIIDPQKGTNIKLAKNELEIAKNNLERI